MGIEILGKIFFSPREIAEMLKVSKPSVHKLVRHGVLESIRIGTKILVSEESLDDFLTARKLNRASAIPCVSVD